MNISNEDIGKRIRALRESKNMTIQNLADAVSCNYDHLQKAEKGKRGLGLNTLVMICHEFGITMDELVCGLQQPDPYQTLYGGSGRTSRHQHPLRPSYQQRQYHGQEAV